MEGVNGSSKEDVTMSNKPTKLLATLGASLMLLAAGLAAPASAQVAEQAAVTRALEGTWQAVVTLRDCATLAPRAPFASLLTFARGGTLTETTANAAFQPGQRSPGHGVWSFAGVNHFRAASNAYILFDSEANPPVPGFQHGQQRITQDIRIAADPDVFTSVATVQFFDAAGQALATACATAVAHRYR